MLYRFIGVCVCVCICMCSHAFSCRIILIQIISFGDDTIKLYYRSPLKYIQNVLIVNKGY